MDWAKNLTEGLPPHNEWEPIQLRQDIVDELEDHLNCDMERELRKSGDLGKAQNNVLNRFGDPRRIAYQLWFDAMKEAIMTQRVMLGSVIVLVLICLAVSVFAWVSVRQTQEVNRLLMNKLETAPVQKSEASIPSNMGLIKVRLVEGIKTGKPFTGVGVSLDYDEYIRETSQHNRKYFNGTTDKEGIITYLVPADSSVVYSLRVGYSSYSTQYQLRIEEGGREYEKVIVCPKPKESVSREVAFNITPQTKGNREKLFIGCSFIPVKQNFGYEGNTWTQWNNEVLLTLDGRFVRKNPRSWNISDQKEDKGFKPIAGQYYLTEITLFMKDPNAKDSYGKPTIAYRQYGSFPIEKLIFDAQLEGKNQWTLPLPEKMVTEIQNLLKEDPKKL